MTHNARVMWLSPEEGGRNSLPDGLRYVTIGRFPEEGPLWPDGAWSVVLDFSVPPSKQGNPSLGAASFLMESAPSELLRAGQRFALYEGLRKVADVDIEP